MSEEEIIKNLNDLLEHNYLEDVGYLREENDYIVYNNAIQGLLDLYKKEKEKNNMLKSKLKEHIKFCETEAAGSLHNDICKRSLFFDKSLLKILEEG